MKEKDLQSRVNKHMQNTWSGNAVFELKICHEKSLPFTAVKPHQLENLRIAKYHRLAYKIPDVGMDQKPFDMIVLEKVPAYILVMFYTRGCKHFYLIDVDVYSTEMLGSDRRSLTEERANEIGSRHEMP